MLAPREALLLSRSDYLPIDDKRRRRTWVEGQDAQNRSHDALHLIALVID
jgi:hypothetical protein